MGQFSLEEIVSRVMKIGLDGVCITDHESNAIMERAHDYSKRTGFLILVGAEILTHEGDFMVFGMDRLPLEKRHAQDVVNMALSVGGVAISAHLFRQNNFSPERLDFLRDAIFEYHKQIESIAKIYKNKLNKKYSNVRYSL